MTELPDRLCLIAACVLLVVLPSRYDPAIRLKEWTGEAS